MRDFTIDEWLTEVTGLVLALSASESLLLRRLQQLRREIEGARLGPLRASPLPESHPFDPRPQQETFDPIPVRAPQERTAERLARAMPTGPTAPLYAPRTPQWASHSQEDWPRDSGEKAAAASTTRSYDYFAELDEKLAVLHRSSREA